jgi:hypothetical protein
MLKSPKASDAMHGVDRDWLSKVKGLDRVPMQDSDRRGKAMACLEDFGVRVQLLVWLVFRPSRPTLHC